MNTLTYAIRFAGVMHLGMLSAGLLMTQVLHWKTELRQLSAFSRQVVWTHAVYIFATVLAIGVASLVMAPRLSAGDLLARVICGYIAVFWGARLILQIGVFDSRPYLGHWLRRVGNVCVTFALSYFTAVYAWAALRWT